MTTTKQSWLKRSLAVLLAVMMVMSMGVANVFAAGMDEVSIPDANLKAAINQQIAKQTGSQREDTAAITEDEMNTVVATCGDYELTNAELSFYYWQQVSTYGSYASMMGADFTQPLSEQMYNEEASWEDLFLQMAMDAFWRTSSVNQAATAAGFELDEAVRRLEVEDFPVVVIIDSQGNNLYEKGRADYLNSLR